jgi:hypothetical protein
MIALHSCLATRKIRCFKMGSSPPDSGIAATSWVRSRRKQPAEFVAIAALTIVLMAGNNVGSIERRSHFNMRPARSLQFTNPRAQWYLSGIARIRDTEERKWLEPRSHRPEYQVHFP